MMTPATSRRLELIQSRQHPDHIPYSARFSPDGRYISFHVRTGNPLARQIFIAPFRGDAPIDERDWLPVTDGSAMDRETYWSPDGNLLYFLSDRDGFRCIWAQHLDPLKKEPVGEPFAVQHFHHARRSLASVAGPASAVGICVARDKMVFALGEITGNIWMMTGETP